MEFSLPLQRFIGEHPTQAIAAPTPYITNAGTLSATRGPLLFALYTFVEGTTYSEAYPLPAELVRRIGETLATLHAIEIPTSLQQKALPDLFTIRFDESLRADLEAIERIGTRDAPYLQRLRDILLPHRNYIFSFWARSNEYYREAQLLQTRTVVCHGDPWGGNIMPSPEGKLVLIDWESAAMAPSERDVFFYIGFNNDDFPAFNTGYSSVYKGQANWNRPLLAYYAYRIQLRNLETWLHKLVHEPLNEVQRENDIGMIQFHCLNRLERVEAAVVALERV